MAWKRVLLYLGTSEATKSKHPEAEQHSPLTKPLIRVVRNLWLPADGGKNQFSSGMCSLRATHIPEDGPKSMRIWAAVSRACVLMKPVRGDRGRKDKGGTGEVELTKIYMQKCNSQIIKKRKNE